VIQHVASQTERIRVGAGGIMLPNHAPLVIAEQFGTLATLFPGRIDLGLGRAPGTDMLTARALRRHMAPEDSFPQDVVELLASCRRTRRRRGCRRCRGRGPRCRCGSWARRFMGRSSRRIWGCPTPSPRTSRRHLEEALEAYRATFRPSQWLEAPHVMVAMGACAARTDEEAEWLRSSQVMAFARLRTGKPGRLPPPGPLDGVPPEGLAMARGALSFSAVGGPASVRRRLEEVQARFRPDEIILAGMIFDLEARLESLRIVAAAAGEVRAAA
jgi:alkanesulfonate monooxygenase SsuD/methylene tetrahydromethanopterin reductase-like flavin-dependent oxidoreductase (luciferase family)